MIYRGQDAAQLADSRSLEEVAALLWAQPAPPVFGPGEESGGSPFEALARHAAGARASIGRSAEARRRDGAKAIGALAEGFGLPRGPALLHHRLAARWAVGPDGADIIRRALVLMADHELNASTFAVRVTASTGASIAACLLAGLAALSGPRHGGAGAALASLMEECERTGAAAALDRWLALGNTLPGFGHILYPEGDARAVALRDHVAADETMAALCAEALAATGSLPNIDLALCAMARSLRLPDDAPFTIFALGRSIGWVAHAIEQGDSAHLIRPRARYEGSMPA